MSTAFSRMAEAVVFDPSFGETVTHTPDGGVAYALRASVSQESDVGIGGDKFVSVFAPATQWTTAPEADDTLTIDGVSYRIAEPPVKREGAYAVKARVAE